MSVQSYGVTMFEAIFKFSMKNTFFFANFMKTTEKKLLSEINPVIVP